MSWLGGLQRLLKCAALFRARQEFSYSGAEELPAERELLAAMPVGEKAEVADALKARR